jgi:hypothetical protein
MRSVKGVLVLLASLLLVISLSVCASALKTKSTNISAPPATKAIPVMDKPDTALLQPLDPQKFTISRSGIINSAYAYDHMTCTQMPNGKILVAWSKLTENNAGVGEAVIFSPDMQYQASVYYTNPAQDTFRIGDNVAFALDNNTVLIAYGDTKDHNAKYVIVDDTGNIVKGPVVFNDSETNSITITFLPGRKTVLLAYQKLFGVTGRGEFQVLNEAGDRLLGPIVFNNKGYTTSISVALNDGLIFLNYNCAYGKNKVFDAYGNVVRDEVKFLVKPIQENYPFVLDNDNILLVYRNDISQGMASILSPQGSVVSGPAPFTTDGLIALNASRLKNGNIFVLYNKPDGPDQRAVFTVLDQTGGRIKELRLVSDQSFVWNGAVAHTVLSNGKVLVIYGGVQKNASGNMVKQLTEYIVVN